MNEKIYILDFGSQYTQLIARSVRELRVYCEIYPFYEFPPVDETVKAVILSGSPYSVCQPDSPDISPEKILAGIPVLGICYGAQLFARHFGGEVEPSDMREYGKAWLEKVYREDPILQNISQGSQVWMSHGDTITQLPEPFEPIAGTNNIPTAVYRSKDGIFKAPFYGLQFHPEVSHSLDGAKILHNFLYDIAQCHGEWTPASFISETVQDIRECIGEDGILMGLSGGVDSTVAARLIQEAIGDHLICFFIDNGLLRKYEYEDVLTSYKHLKLNVIGIDAKERFWKALKGVTDPEEKRKIIGRAFIEVFEEEAAKLPHIHWLGQGTIYPDVIESVSVHGPSATIKSHHNVGGLPDRLNLKIIEPLRMLFKDEVRSVGKELGIPNSIIGRHPFPGPGLAIRILGEITPEKVRLLQDVDHIFISNLKKEGLYDQVWQAAAILLPVHSVGVMGDERTYEQAIVLRAVNSRDGMTAEWTQLPYSFLSMVSSQIINQVKGINRVVYDISTKPPATIEWE
jgi:GMP synthase (glutamine-hydrolysing)